MTSDHSAPSGDWHDQQRELDRQALQSWQPPPAGAGFEKFKLGVIHWVFLGILATIIYNIGSVLWFLEGFVTVGAGVP